MSCLWYASPCWQGKGAAGVGGIGTWVLGERGHGQKERGRRHECVGCRHEGQGVRERPWVGEGS